MNASARSIRAAAPARLRCAIYTRKSSEEGLEQDFNSLHAQREACEAYVTSQAGEGWAALPAAYDDGGYSGGSMERPGLQRLMADIDAGRIDVVVVYKVDRLTRSLADFAKIVERFDAQGVSFVSVTQAFNTTSSMGRLTLNVLLSFAQFEREVTGERIRDKIAASKRKGMWMGGTVPLGYEAQGRALVINPTAAEQVRGIFRRYLELGSVHVLRDELERQGIRSNIRTTKAGRVLGGAVFGRGALFHLLSNRHYLGEIVHKTESFPGLHLAIIDQDLFDAVQARLAQNGGAERRAKVGLEPNPPRSPLSGKVFDALGNKMSHTACRRGGRVYRYYVSTAALQGRAGAAGGLRRCPAQPLEALVRDRLMSLGLMEPGGDLRAPIDRVVVRPTEIAISLRNEPSPRLRLASGDRLTRDGPRSVLVVAATSKWRSGSKIAIAPDGSSAIDGARVDPALLKGLARAETWKHKMLRQGATFEAAIGAEKINLNYARRLIRVAFLAPEVKRAILDGRTPQGLTLNRLLQREIPLSWADQLEEFC